MSSPITQLTLSEYQALVSGIPKYCPKAIFTVAGQTFTANQAVTFITSVLNAVSAVASAKTGWKDARLAEEQVLAQDGATVKAIRENIGLMFSNNTTTLAAFEIAPKKPRQPLSAAARAAATAKAKATRIARGTVSKKQKSELTGGVTGVTITPVTSSSSKTTATSPSAGAPAAATTSTAVASATAPTATPSATTSSVTTPTTGATSVAQAQATPAASNQAAPATAGAAHA